MLLEAYKAGGIKDSINDEDIRIFMKICDKDGDGKLSYKEYEKFIIRAMNPTHKKNE